MASRATAAAEARIAPPDQAEDEVHSGRLLLRMPQSLHGELARAAEREHVSLNAYIIAALSATVRWRADGDGAQPREDGMPRLLRIAIIADLVLVAVAACVAVALLIAAL